MSIKQRLQVGWIKLTQYEYWPWWVLYLPLLPLWLFEALLSGRIRYFMAVNPGLPRSGFYGADKKVILDLIPERYKPHTLQVSAQGGMVDIPKDWHFPFIAKPLKGQRGKGVRRIENAAQWKQYVAATKEDFILQEYVPYCLELAVLYYRMPGTAQGRITSVTQKEFLHVIGDGRHSISELTLHKPRAAMQYQRIKPQFDADFWNAVPDIGTRVELEPIGNHCRGTRFISANCLINSQLQRVFDDIANSIEGFHYGRYDLRVASLEDLYQGENIRILELNGVNADPAHIFDRRHGLFNSIRDLYVHSRLIGKIARKNLSNKALDINSQALKHLST